MRPNAHRSPFKLGLSLAAALSLLLQSQHSRAADCDCDYQISPDQGSINGAELGVKPGEVVCIEAGKREFLRIFEMEGSEDSPIVIKNCDGQVRIDNEERGYGLTLEGSRYVQVTGTGDADHEYGFVVRASREGPDYSASCIVAGALSSDYEIDHIEAYDCGFAGVTSKTDPSCERQDMSDFVQYNTRLHHLYLHDTGGEGIYFGNTGYPSRKGTCDGKEVDLIPHTHEGVWIHDNTIEDTGWDGLQVGVSPKDCYIYRNRIVRVGLDHEEYQEQGLQIGGGSQCEINDNFLQGGSAMGIIVLDASSTLIKNNVIVDFDGGIYINDRDSDVTEGAQYQVIHNTIVDTTSAISIYGSRSAGNAFINNLLVKSTEDPLKIGSEVDAVNEGNLILETVEEALFLDPSESNFQLQESSPAVDAGVDAGPWGVTVDQLGAERDSSPDPGAIEYGSDAPEDPLSPPGPGEGQSSSKDDVEDGGGCSWQSPRGDGGYAYWIFCALLASATSLRRGRDPTAVLGTERAATKGEASP